MLRSTLADHDWPTLAAAFNTVYEKYMMPVNMTEDQVKLHFTGNHVALDQSPLWQDEDGRVVALAALGVRGDRGWIGGFGVALPYRGRGLSYQLMDQVLDQARTLGLKSVRLEVLMHNPIARHAYERAGFTVERDLRIFARSADEPRPEIDTSCVHPADPTSMIAYAAQVHTTPCWQRERIGLAAQPGLEALSYGDPAAPHGYVVYHATSSGVRVADIVALHSEAVAALTAALAERYPQHGFSLLNEPEESLLCAALEQHGWQETMRQHEMRYTIA